MHFSWAILERYSRFMDKCYVIENEAGTSHSNPAAIFLKAVVSSSIIWFWCYGTLISLPSLEKEIYFVCVRDNITLIMMKKNSIFLSSKKYSQLVASSTWNFWHYYKKAAIYGRFTFIMPQLSRVTLFPIASCCVHVYISIKVFKRWWCH